MIWFRSDVGRNWIDKVLWEKKLVQFNQREFNKVRKYDKTYGAIIDVIVITRTDMINRREMKERLNGYYLYGFQERIEYFISISNDL